MQVGDSGPIARHIIPYDTNANEAIFALQHVIDVIELELVLLCHSIVQGLTYIPACPALPTSARVRMCCVVEVVGDGPTGRHDGIVVAVNVQPDHWWQAVFGFGRCRLAEPA